TISRKPDGAWAGFQPWIVKGEQSGLQTHIRDGKRFVVRADEKLDCVRGARICDSSDQLIKSVAACGSWHLRFSFDRPAKREREHRKHLQRRRVITATEKRGEIEAHALCWPPCKCGADYQPFYCAIRFYCLAAAAVLHFKPNLKLLFW